MTAAAIGVHVTSATFSSRPYDSASATSGGGVPWSSEKRNPSMKTRILRATVGGAAAALAAGVMWTAPSASAGSDFCNSLPPSQVHDCSCGADNVPGTDEYQQCLHPNAAAPKPADSPPPAPPAPPG